MYTNRDTYINTSIHTYIHMYIYIYTHTCTFMCVRASSLPGSLNWPDSQVRMRYLIELNNFESPSEKLAREKAEAEARGEVPRLGSDQRCM